MQKSMKFLTAAALAIGGITFIGTPALGQAQVDPQIPGAQQHQQQPDHADGAIITERVVVFGILVPADTEQVPEGFERVAIDEADDLKRTLSRIGQAALTRDGGQELLNHLTAADRQRLEGFTENADALNEAIAELNESWKEKYDADLGPDERGNVFTQRFTVMKGEISDPQMLADWPVSPTAEDRDQQEQPGLRQPGMEPGLQQDRPGTPGIIGEPQGGAGLQGGLDQQPGQLGQQDGIGQQDQLGQQDRIGIGIGEPADAQAGDEKEAAVVVFPQDDDAPELYISLLREDGQWRIDVPDTVDADKLRENLVAHLKHVNERIDHLPDDQDAAYRHVVHHVMMALYGLETRAAEPAHEVLGDDALPLRATPAQPARPARPAQPGAPGEPATPAEPADPATPAIPADPDDDDDDDDDDEDNNND